MKISDFSPSSASGDPYAAIRALSRPVSRRHPPMDRLARAAQFAPFSALSGYGDVIHEAGRLTDAAAAATPAACSTRKASSSRCTARGSG